MTEEQGDQLVEKNAKKKKAKKRTRGPYRKSSPVKHRETDRKSNPE